MVPMVAQVLVLTGSVITIGFGVWHFFVPRIWKWYSHIAPDATELVLAVRAINALFSLSLILFGLVNTILIFGDPSDRFSIIVMLSATSILWLTRLVLQLVYPQGSQNPVIQYCMLAVFVLVSVCFLVSLYIVASHVV
jgi:hypothetical protein